MRVIQQLSLLVAAWSLAPQSEDVVIDERFSLSEDGTDLYWTARITDPVHFTAPVRMEARWTWVPGDEIKPFECAVLVVEPHVLGAEADDARVVGNLTGRPAGQEVMLNFQNHLSARPLLGIAEHSAAMEMH